MKSMCFHAASRTLHAAGLGLLVGAAVGVLGSAAHATSFTLDDDYYGGTNTYNNNPPASGDVIGPSSIFDVTSAVASLNSNTLTVTINTYFAGAPNNASIATDVAGTTYGSLFLGSASAWNADHPTTGAPWPTDTFHPAEWTYAVATTGTNGGTAGVYALGTVTTPGVVYGSAQSTSPGATNPTGVVQYYNTSTGGKVGMSNVSGNPITYPNGGQTQWYFRQGQAVTYTPGSTQSAVASSPASWSIDPTTYDPGTETATSEGSVTYTIDDFSALDLGPEFAISWAMTCANDVIQGVILVQNNVGQTPLPATLPLFAGGLGLLGFARLRRRNKVSAARVA